MTPLDAITAGPALWYAAMTAYNLRAWPDDRATAATTPRLSVLIPARNEEQGIAACVRSALAATPAVHEVIVCDDDSTDRTPEILAALAATDPRLRVIRGGALPPGWAGKPHACHQLGQAAAGDVLWFLDADVALSADAPARLADLLDRFDAGLLSLFPRQRMDTAAERWLLPMLPVTFTAWFPIDAMWRHPDDRLSTISGQSMAFTREAYDDLGGYASIRDALVDDVAIARRAKALGHRTVFATGNRTATCRMYDSGAAMWAGFSKNLYPGIGATPAALVGVCATYLGVFVAPYAILAAQIVDQAVTAGVGAAVLLHLAARAALARRLGHTVGAVLLHPVAAGFAVAVAINSWRWTTTGRIAWKGRTYPGAAR